MGFRNELVEVKLWGCNIQYYKDLGYELPFVIGSKGQPVYAGLMLKVKPQDVSASSKIYIPFDCDNCGKPLHITKEGYTKRNRNGKCYCHACAQSLFNSGENCHFWKSEKTKEEREQDRSYPEYLDFIKKVMARNNYTCQCCGKNSNEIKLVVHHLDGYNWCVERRTDETNGITLCESCHKNFHSHYGLGNNTKEQFEEWFGEAIAFVESNIEIPSSRLIYNITTGETLTTRQFMTKYNNRHYIVACSKDTHRKCAGMILAWKDEYDKMSEEEIQAYIKMKNTKAPVVITKKPDRGVKVVCIETNEIFNSYLDACEKYNLNHDSFIQVMINAKTSDKIPSYGRDKNGKYLHWVKLEDYKEMSEEDKIIKLCRSHSKPIIFLNNGKLYESIVDASSQLGIKKTTINTNILKQIKKSIIKYNNKPIRFIRYEDFIQMTQKEKQDIYNNYKEFFEENSFLLKKFKEENNVI